MGPEGCVSSKGPGVGATFVHKRSKSFPDKRKNGEDNLDGFLEEASDHSKLDTGHFKDSVKTKKKQSPRSTIQTSLKQEILQLEKKLQDQVIVRRALEKALGDGSSSRDFINEASLPKHASDLIQEIAVLELEVVHLEQYLLSLYRKTFDQQISLSPSVKDVGLKSPLIAPRKRFLEASRSEASCLSLANPWNESGSIGEEKLLDSTVQRCHSSLSQRTFRSNRTSPPTESLAKLLRACHSQPLSMLEYASPNVISLADHLGTPIRDHVPETPNKLSEDMIKCISSIYCKLSDPPLTNHYVSSPNSSLSSLSAFSPKDQFDIWSPGLRKDSSFDVRLDNPFHVEGLKEFSGPYSTMVEVSRIHRDTQKLGDIEDMLQCFRLLIGQLEGIDPRKMKHEEKLAFWINVHNALVMHAYLAYGIPQSNAKRVFLLLKAAYNIGGHIVSADTIQDPILGCRMSRPGQWLRFLLPSRTKFKAGDERQEFAVKNAEPLLHFALCSGSHSDPAVRVYTPKSVIQELEIAKEEYIRATFGVRKDKKILLPKIVESFAKDSGLPPAGVREVIEKCLPESVKKNVNKCQSGKSGKSIEWVPYNFAFRYLISKELVK